MSPLVHHDALALAGAVLHDYARRDEPSPEVLDADAGPAVLASMVLGAGRLADDVADRVLARWMLTCQARLSGHPGLYGGLAGLWAGARLMARYRPQLSTIVASLGEALVRGRSSNAWQDDGVAWHDYDLVSGPAGVVLAATLDAPGDGHEAALTAARHLAALCDDDGLERLRVASYADDELRAWNHGRINTGLAHGVGGVVAGLTAAARRGHDEPALRAGLRRAAVWLARQTYVDPYGLRTWPPAALEGAAPPRVPSRRQAWCYGTPGLAWVLWEAGRALGDADLVARAEDAMRSFCDAFDVARHLDPGPPTDALGLCHGAAGILAVADAFAVNARLPPAAALADRLERQLLERLNQVYEISTTDVTLLTGASGILAMLSTRAGGSRAWLGTLALR